MKKLGLLVMPLMAISLLASCNNGGGGGGGEDSPEVTKEEFDHAVNFDGVKRMQSAGTQHIIYGGIVMDVTSSQETSELIFYACSIQKVQENETKNEICTRIKNIGDEDCEVTMNTNDTGWTTPGESLSSKFGFTADYYNPLKNLEKDYEKFAPSLEYENFSFTEDKYVYNGTAKVKEYETETSISLTLNFKNKILVSSLYTLEDNTSTVQDETSYKFENKVPTWPFPNF